MPRSKKTQKTITDSKGKRRKVYSGSNAKNKAKRAQDRAPSSQKVVRRKDKFGVYYTVQNVD